MATHYVEFDTNSHNLLTDLRAQILTSTDWVRLTADTVLLSTNAATNAGATSLPFASTGTDLAVGQTIQIGEGAAREWRNITAMSATTITVAAMTYAHPAGTAIRSGSELYKATTTRGAPMVIDLSDSYFGVNFAGLSAAVYQDHDGVTGVGRVGRFLRWRHDNGGAITHPLHVILSLGKEHFFLLIEGARAGETGAINAVYGSLRNYIFLGDIVPYDATDTIPVVFAGGQLSNTQDGSFANMSHIGHVSESLDGNSSWVQSRLATLEFPKAGFGDTWNCQRQRAADGKFMLSPYVVFQDDTGMRGRLESFFFAGFSQADLGSADVPPPPAWTKIEYQGNWYKLIPVNKSDAARHCWSQFGASTQSTGTTYGRSPVVAVPCLP